MLQLRLHIPHHPKINYYDEDARMPTSNAICRVYDNDRESDDVNDWVEKSSRIK